MARSSLGSVLICFDGVAAAPDGKSLMLGPLFELFWACLDSLGASFKPGHESNASTQIDALALAREPDHVDSLRM
jgi:hypothetical protein